jgi:DNA repair protein RadC
MNMTITINPLSAQSENQADYKVVKAADLVSALQKQHEDEVIAKALVILDSRMRTPGQTFDAPDAVKAFLSLAIGEKPHEVFGVLFLDVHNRLLAFEEMFQGTLTQTSVYPREVVLRALHHQASAVVLSHNHPSGALEPSRADELLTQTLKTTLAFVDVRVLDHIIVSHGSALSMAERGIL